MSYIYIVTRVINSVKPGFTEIPNLGVHTSYVKAKNHFDGVVSAREIEFKETIRKTGRYPASFYSKERNIVLDSARVVANNEEVRLERWSTK